MDEQVLLEQLEGVAKALEIEVRYENLRKESRYNPGGLCRIRGEKVIIVHRKALLEEKVRVLAAAVKRFDLNGVYLRPGLREFLAQVEPGGTVEAGDLFEHGDDAAGET